VTDHKYRVFNFGGVEVREREFLLIKAGEVLPVEPKAFRVLLHLLRNPNRLVTKEEILDAVWAETAVSDNSLTRSIATLRRLLGDDSREPRYIGTVPTVGYRLLCAVDVFEEDQGEQAVSETLPASAANDTASAGLRVPVALACMAGIVLGIAAHCFVRQRIDIINQIPMENSSEVLAAKARQVAQSFGYTDRPRDAIFGWEYNTEYLVRASRQKGYSVRHAGFSNQHPPPVLFWYRESPILSPDFYGAYAPPRLERATFQAGTLAIVLDSEGRLMEFSAQPSPGSPVLQQTPAWDWSRLFAAAGLDPARFTPVQPVATPLSAIDSQAAWTGSWDSNPQHLLRVEAAVYGGRPIDFRISGLWTHPDQHPGWSPGWFTFNTFLLFAVVFPLAAGLLTWHSIRLGKSDWRGAFKVAGWTVGLMFLGGLAGTPHVMAYAEIAIIFSAFRDSLVVGIIFFVLYMGVDSQVRSRSPRALDSWDRILAGKLRVPAVGGDILIGLAIGVLALLPLNFVPLPFIEPIAPRLLPNAGAYVSLWCWEIVVSVGGTLSYALALSVLVLLVRRRWLAVSIFVVAVTIALSWGHTEGTLLAAIRPALLLLVLAVLLLRFGVLSVVAFLYAVQILPSFPITADSSTWYARTALLAIASVLLPAGYAFYTTVAGQALWPKKFQSV
jgi:DNA-binding winged helix-turn-helix (wHTH) protein